ncbi:MAG: S-layer homology domain-containing protein [Candidatus Gracilibacteria bacterium]
MPTDVLGTTASETTLLEIQLDAEKVDLTTKGTYTFTSYGIYSTTTVPINTSWTLANTSLGTLSCGDEQAKTCTFTAGSTEGTTTLTASQEENETTLTDSATISVTAPVVNPYKDSLPTWAQTSIVSMYNAGIMTGYNDGNFGVSDSLTNAQVVTLLYRLLVYTGSINDSDLTTDKTCAVYTDVPKTHYAYTPICYFYREGWIDSTSTKFNPTQMVSRGTMSAYVYKVFGTILDVENSASLYNSSYSFTDVKSTSPYYTAVQSLSTAGIMTGYGNSQFGLNVNVNRAEAAVILKRLFDLLNASEEEAEPMEEIDEESSLFTTCSNESYVRNELVKLLGDDLSVFELRTFDADELEEALDDEKIDFVLAKEDGSLTSKTLTFTYSPLLEDDITVGAGKIKGNTYSILDLPKELSYQVACDKTVGLCGVLTILDEEGTQIEGAFMDTESGLSLIEPADNLIRLLGGTESEAAGARGCHVIYNSANHVDVLAGEDSCTTEEATAWLPQIPQANAEDDEILEAEIQIMLDSDAEFYKINEDTIWSRQRSILAGVNLVYGFVEPVGNADFNILFKIAGQETWLDGYGPTTTNKVELADEINEDDYYMIHHPDPDKNEISFYYVGYDMDTGIAGRAGGVGTFCGEEDENRIHAWGQQVTDVDGGYQFATYYGRFVVSAHEIGHLLNATHEDALINTCGVGLWEHVCGSTIMASGAAGGADPDDRMPFFSPTNSERVRDCVDDALGNALFLTHDDSLG